ncbi:MAG TPA: PadR family transcriptional regulator [Pedococcus sp.]|nr:PadR family transcriptional regulator [Pedococcus sp.]
MAHDPQMLKGVLSLLLLSVLREEPGYGYGIVTRLKAAGFEDLAEGTVYPALARLESAGLLQSHLEPSASGPARKYYRTTPAGVAELAARGRAWRSLVAAVDTVTGAAPPGNEGKSA